MATKLERSGGYSVQTMCGWRYVARRVSVLRVTTYQGGSMRKHGSYRAERKDRMLAHLDAISAVKVRPTGLLIRKQGAK